MDQTKIIEQEIMQKQFHSRCFLQLYNFLVLATFFLFVSFLQSTILWCSFPTEVHPVQEQVS